MRYSLICAPLTAAVIAGLSFAGNRIATADAADGAIILTIAGKITKTNRGGFDPKRDAFLKYHDVKFSRAMSFDRAGLLKLPQTVVKAATGFYPDLSSYQGPRLAAVLKLVGAENYTSVKFLALDGYAVELSREEIVGKDWIIALTRDGKGLALGGLGPLLILHTPKASDGRVVKAEEEK